MHKRKVHYEVEVFKLTKLTIFAALLRDIPMGCKDAVLPESLLKKSYNYLPYLRAEHQKAIQRQSLPLQSTCSPLAWK